MTLATTGNQNGRQQSDPDHHPEKLQTPYLPSSSFWKKSLPGRTHPLRIRKRRDPRPRSGLVEPAHSGLDASVVRDVAHVLVPVPIAPRVRMMVYSAIPSGVVRVRNLA